MKTNIKQQFASMIIDAINDGRIEGIDVSEIHNEVFNTDYFIIGYYEAEKWLTENYGIFAAIEKVREYELQNFGEQTTDISSSEKLVNMLAYILGEELISELNCLKSHWGEECTPEILEELKNELEEH